MSDLMKPQLEVIRERMQRATPGPWAWFGNTAYQHVYLATQRWGRHLVMDFKRWGMQHAQPVFYGRDDPSAIAAGRVSNGDYQPASEIPVYEVDRDARSKSEGNVYREDLAGLRNADASFIAHSREDIEWLVGEIDRLHGIIDAGTATSADGQSLRLVGWVCEHRWNTESEGNHLDWDHRKSKLVKAPNVLGSTYPLGPWGRDEPERRCPFAKPMYALGDPGSAGSRMSARIPDSWSFRLLYPRPPKGLSANDRVYWTVRHKFTQIVRAEVVAKVRASGVPMPHVQEFVAGRPMLTPRLKRIQVDVTWWVTDNRRRDSDNLAPLCKAIYDGIGADKGTSARIVPDDAPQYMVKTAPTIQRLPAGGTAHFEVRITDLGGAA